MFVAFTTGTSGSGPEVDKVPGLKQFELYLNLFRFMQELTVLQCIHASCRAWEPCSPNGCCRAQVKEAVRLVRQDRPDLAVEGPIQYDAAVDPVVAAVKVKGESAVAGLANVCIFPDLNTGNNTYKVCLSHKHVYAAFTSFGCWRLV